MIILKNINKVFNFKTSSILNTDEILTDACILFNKKHVALNEATKKRVKADEFNNNFRNQIAEYLAPYKKNDFIDLTRTLSYPLARIKIYAGGQGSIVFDELGDSKNSLDLKYFHFIASFPKVEQKDILFVYHKEKQLFAIINEEREVYLTIAPVRL